MKLHLPITLYIVCFFAAPNAKAWDYSDVSFKIIGTISLLTPIASMVPRLMSLSYYFDDLEPTCQQLAHLNQSTFNHSGHNEILIHPLVEHCVNSSEHTSTSHSLSITLMQPASIATLDILFTMPILMDDIKAFLVCFPVLVAISAWSLFLNSIFDGSALGILDRVDNWIDVAFQNNTQPGDTLKKPRVQLFQRDLT